LSEEELKSQLRELEIEEYSEVKLCTLEGTAAYAFSK
jgi:uncharacterized membrane protein YcaP (DUF421 family)